MIGVNCFNEDPDNLKDVMTRENLNWRSFAGNDDMARQWNAPATPTFYVIDHEGTIRRKWVGGSPGEAAMDAALETLIREAGESNVRR